MNKDVLGFYQCVFWMGLIVILLILLFNWLSKPSKESGSGSIPGGGSGRGGRAPYSSPKVSVDPGHHASCSGIGCEHDELPDSAWEMIRDREYAEWVQKQEDEIRTRSLPDILAPTEPYLPLSPSNPPELPIKVEPDWVFVPREK